MTRTAGPERQLQPNPSPRSTVTVLLTVALSLAAFAAAQADVAPFYRSLFDEGRRNLSAGRAAEAQRQIQIAAFGFLDEPALLTEALVNLAVARGETGDREGFLEALDRLVEVERLFQTYAMLSLDANLESALTARASQWNAEDRLAGVAAFAPLVRRMQLNRLGTLGPAERISELEKLATSAPADTTWQLMLSEALVTAGRGAEAIERLDLLRSLLPGDSRAACLGERAYLQSRQCATFERLLRCEAPALPRDELELMVDCLIAAERWTEAGSLITALAPAVQATRPFVRRQKQIVAALGEGAVLPPLATYAPAEEAGPATAAPSAPPTLATATPRVSPARLAELRRQLDTAATRDALVVATSAVESLAEHHQHDPELRWLAGEANYRAGAWERAAHYLTTPAEPPFDRPELLFYLAVSLYESGEGFRAAEVLRRALPGLESTAVVERYRATILEGAAPPGRG